MEVDTELKDELPSSDSDKCRCCLQEGELKELWSEYMVDDGVKIYGETLVECFSLALHQPEDVVEKICVTCIGKLHDAHTFKKLVMQSDQKLLEQYIQGEELKMDDDVENLQCEQQSLSDENYDYSEKEYSADEKSSDGKKKLSAEDLELELLEAAGSNEPINTKVPVRKSRSRKIIKKYERTKLEECLEAVKTEVMTKSEAAKFFNIPYKTVYGNLRRSELMKDDSTPTKIDEKKENFKKFLQEIKTILKFTNATPYKSQSCQFCCAYCRMKFDDAVELRSHTSSVHAGERFSGVDLFMTPSWLNECIKLDIVDLRCTICPAPIEKWNDMFIHLKEKHRAEFDEAYTRVIPYKLTAAFVCTLCDERCDSFTILDSHMNTHYTNYICGECGDSFLSETRLKTHLGRHSTEKFKCPFCPKFFALEKYRKKHVDSVHQQCYFYNCRYCKEQFLNELDRHKHMEKNHSDKIKSISCKFCDKIFTFRPYYLMHERTHTKKGVKPHKCSDCDRVFATKYKLKKHEEWHLGQHRQTCLVCNRSFASKNYLEKHFNKVHADTDVLVLETDQS